MPSFFALADAHKHTDESPSIALAQPAVTHEPCRIGHFLACDQCVDSFMR
jgi:hypothetical protein